MRYLAAAWALAVALSCAVPASAQDQLEYIAVNIYKFFAVVIRKQNGICIGFVKCKFKRIGKCIFIPLSFAEYVRLWNVHWRRDGTGSREHMDKS